MELEAAGRGQDRSLMVAVVGAVARRPGLWGVALRQAAILARPRWWRRWPPLPVPDPAYLRFRLVTAYGDGSATPSPDDVVSYLRWCRSARVRGSRGGAR